MPDTDFLVATCSFLQSSNIYSYQNLANGYGGTYMGIYLNQEESEWLKQTLYFLYSDHISNGGEIRLVQVIPDTDSSLLLIFTQNDGSHTVEQIFQSDIPDGTTILIELESLWNNYQYIAFINTSENYIQVMDKNCIDRANRSGSFRLNYRSNGFDLYIGPELRDFLIRPNKLEGHSCLIRFDKG